MWYSEKEKEKESEREKEKETEIERERERGMMAGKEHWALCSEWLKRVGLIGSDHLLATDQAKLSDLCRFLRDGVMLCKLLYQIDKYSIDLRSINQRPQKAQVCINVCLMCLFIGFSLFFVCVFMC